MSPDGLFHCSVQLQVLEERVKRRIAACLQYGRAVLRVSCFAEVH